MNKTALGTIIGSALLGLAKSKGSKSSSLPAFAKRHVVVNAYEPSTIVVSLGYWNDMRDDIEKDYEDRGLESPFNDEFWEKEEKEQKDFIAMEIGYMIYSILDKTINELYGNGTLKEGLGPFAEFFSIYVSEYEYDGVNQYRVEEDEEYIIEFNNRLEISSDMENFATLPPLNDENSVEEIFNSLQGSIWDRVYNASIAEIRNKTSCRISLDNSEGLEIEEFEDTLLLYDKDGNLIKETENNFETIRRR